jgi:aminopeptidase N
MMDMKTLAALALSGIFAVGLQTAQAQDTPANNANLDIYRAAAPKMNDLVHTKLDVRFDYKKRYMYGKEWVTLKPHFYPTDSLRLDAKGMDIKNVSVVKDGKNITLKYKYDDSLTLAIRLDKVYHNSEPYTIYIDYTSKPDLLKVKGSAAINDAKGLYFINPDSTEKGKPVQIWTQGETESSSAWFPTIDKPDQKTTEEISMTVLSKYVTLSNGRLASQKNNGNGTRTDTWKMDLPHSPYLFMMAVGDFKIYHDKWRDKEVNYYLEPKYAPYAKEIFGMTPELIEFYSKTLGVDFPWNKYSQIVVRDYVSGAMENTTATLHGEYVQGTHRQLIDRYYDAGRSTIAHELFHQWFGDYVTALSWSNLTVNESFADFSEMLWAEHKYGKDAADEHSHEALTQYFDQPDAATKDLVRFNYDDKEDVFDVVTYQKGGRVLNMLRNYLGNAAFFRGLNIYLKTNAFKNGEAQQLRLAMQEACGLDLNWFFNQWYYNAGHPVLNINYKWDDASKTEHVYLKQSQDGEPFKLPFVVDVYAGGKKVRYKEWMNDKMDTLTFHADSKPDLVNVDADNVLLALKIDNKPFEQYVFQFFNAQLYMDRFDAIEAAQLKQTEPDGRRVLIAALKDKYYGLRLKAIGAINMNDADVKAAATPVLLSLARTDDNTLVRAAAMNILGRMKSPEYMDLFKKALGSESYAIQAAALNGINRLDPAQALQAAKTFEKDNDGPLTDAIINVYAESGNSAQWAFVYDHYMEANRHGKVGLIRKLAQLTGSVSNPVYAEQGITALKDFAIRYNKEIQDVNPFVIRLLNNIKEQRATLKDDASVKAAEAAEKSVNEAK